MENKYQSEEFINRLKDAFDEMVVYKDLEKSNFISSFKQIFLKKMNGKQFSIGL